MPSDEQVLVKEQRQSGIFDNAVINTTAASHVSAALSSDERKKFNDERTKLFMQLDEKVSSFKLGVFLIQLLLN